MDLFVFVSIFVPKWATPTGSAGHYLLEDLVKYDWQSIQVTHPLRYDRQISEFSASNNSFSELE